MKIETLKEKIAKANEKITKKQNTIAKKEAWILKKNDEYEIKWLREDIKRLNEEIEETKKTIEKYQKQLLGEEKKEKLFISEIPEIMKELQGQLVERWDRFDIEKRNRIKEEYKTLEYNEWRKKYTIHDIRILRYKTDEQIHEGNMNDAKALILDLYNRVRSITGEVTDWDGIRATEGTAGMTVLNGYVIGKEGRAKVESILAGGYNIQRLHVRVLVHEI